MNEEVKIKHLNNVMMHKMSLLTLHVFVLGFHNVIWMEKFIPRFPMHLIMRVPKMEFTTGIIKQMRKSETECPLNGSI